MFDKSTSSNSQSEGSDSYGTHTRIHTYPPCVDLGGRRIIKKKRS